LSHPIVFALKIKGLSPSELFRRTVEQRGFRRPRSALSSNLVLELTLGKKIFCGFAPRQGALMPAYQNTTPPISLMPGDVGFSFNNEAFPGSAQAGSQFA